jgi:hypothetical protein
VVSLKHLTLCLGLPSGNAKEQKDEQITRVTAEPGLTRATRKDWQAEVGNLTCSGFHLRAPGAPAPLQA